MSKSLTLFFSLLSLASAAELTWTSCGTGLECSSLTVPLEYETGTTSTATASIALIRYLSTVAADQRLGSLLVNPGGPGASGYSFVQSGAGEAISNITGGLYDVVGWDPRGVGKSTPLMQCFPNAGEEFTFSEALPGGPNLWLGMYSNSTYDAEVETKITDFDASVKKLADACVAENSDALYTSSAAYVARDMAAIVDAVDGTDAKLNYWGFSYGTIFLAEFIQAFPGRVGRVVADGAVNPEANAMTYDNQLPNDQISMRDALNDLISFCEDAGTNCPLATPPNGVTGTLTERIDNLFETLFKDPVVYNGFAISLDSFNVLLWSLMRVPVTWSLVANIIAGLEIRDPTAFLTTVSGTAATAPTDPKAPGVATLREFPLTCIDNAPSSSVTLKTVIDLTKSLSIDQDTPLLNAGLTPITFCRNFPDTRPLVPIAGISSMAETDDILSEAKITILIVNPEHDTATPLVSAEKLRSLLPKSSRLAIRRGPGHTSVSLASLSLTQTIRDFFVDGTVPDDLVEHNADQNLFPAGSGGSLVTAAAFSGTSYTPEDMKLLEADYAILLAFLAIA
ncbi:hypothetical protein LZ554_007403 [Drepanopeziza brunnea f. sp. 'monogermtubi']|nr:hypothetical protein LZ554_007403 [Drepanopeziza brunnea f. sp. 'monogermtubi']